MQVGQVLRNTSDKLKFNGIEDYRFEAKCLVEYVTKLNSVQIAIGDADISDEKIKELDSLINKRIKNYPLQYILGEWEFMGYTFKVGEGVLIPRPETEVLVELALEKIKDIESPVVFDLCSGSGCIGISIAKERPDAKVFLFEKYDKAFSFLSENVNSLNAKNVTPVKLDITADYSNISLVQPNIIVSNPPYIRSDEMDGLQSEVKKEPSTALDGGEDGMDFYRVIARKWMPLIKEKGSLIVECDPWQTKPIEKIFSTDNATAYTVLDLNNDPRIVCADIN